MLANLFYRCMSLISKNLNQFYEKDQSADSQSSLKTNNNYLALTYIISSLSMNNRYFKGRFSKKFLEFINEIPLERIFSKSFSKIDQERFIQDIKLLEQYMDQVTSQLISDQELTEINKSLVKEKIFFISYNSENYPRNLKNLEQPPAGLFIKGNKDVIKLFLKKGFEKSIAIVGTRSPTDYGKIKTHEIAENLASDGIIVISGLAKGVDIEAHKGALKKSGITFAVLAGGVNHMYPKEHKQIYDELIQKGLIISERMPDMKPNQQDFTFRNRIVAALGKITLVVEAGLKSGTKSQINYAKSLKKEIVVLEPKERTENNELIYSLMQEGKKTIKSHQDVFKVINKA